MDIQRLCIILQAGAAGLSAGGPRSECNARLRPVRRRLRTPEHCPIHLHLGEQRPRFCTQLKPGWNLSPPLPVHVPRRQISVHALTHDKDTCSFYEPLATPGAEKGCDTGQHKSYVQGHRMQRQGGKPKNACRVGMSAAGSGQRRQRRGGAACWICSSRLSCLTHVYTSAPFTAASAPVESAAPAVERWRVALLPGTSTPEQAPSRRPRSPETSARAGPPWHPTAAAAAASRRRVQPATRRPASHQPLTMPKPAQAVHEEEEVVPDDDIPALVRRLHSGSDRADQEQVPPCMSLPAALLPLLWRCLFDAKPCLAAPPCHHAAVSAHVPGRARPATLTVCSPSHSPAGRPAPRRAVLLLPAAPSNARQRRGGGADAAAALRGSTSWRTRRRCIGARPAGLADPWHAGGCLGEKARTGSGSKWWRWW